MAKAYEYEPEGIIKPPDTVTVDHERRPILYLPDGRVLVKRPAGYRTTEPNG